MPPLDDMERIELIKGDITQQKVVFVVFDTDNLTIYRSLLV
jgi:hypothetical protein